MPPDQHNVLYVISFVLDAQGMFLFHVFCSLLRLIVHKISDVLVTCSLSDIISFENLFNEKHCFATKA